MVRRRGHSQKRATNAPNYDVPEHRIDDELLDFVIHNEPQDTIDDEGPTEDGQSEGEMNEEDQSEGELNGVEQVKEEQTDDEGPTEDGRSEGEMNEEVEVVRELNEEEQYEEMMRIRMKEN